MDDARAKMWAEGIALYQRQMASFGMQVVVHLEEMPDIDRHYQDRTWLTPVRRRRTLRSLFRKGRRHG